MVSSNIPNLGAVVTDICILSFCIEEAMVASKIQKSVAAAAEFQFWVLQK